MRSCQFRTPRLEVGPITEVAVELNAISNIMTASVTKSLPPHWQGKYSLKRTQDWLEECENDGTVVLGVREESNRILIGLMILFVIPNDKDSKLHDLRVGYLFREDSWGHGFASEVVKGLLEWCCNESSEVAKVVGGVALDNPASKRVLLKNGFVMTAESDGDVEEEMFEYTVFTS